MLGDSLYLNTMPICLRWSRTIKKLPAKSLIGVPKWRQQKEHWHHAKPWALVLHVESLSEWMWQSVCVRVRCFRTGSCTSNGHQSFFQQPVRTLDANLLMEFTSLHWQNGKPPIVEYMNVQQDCCTNSIDLQSKRKHHVFIALINYWKPISLSSLCWWCPLQSRRGCASGMNGVQTICMIIFVFSWWDTCPKTFFVSILQTANAIWNDV